LAAAKNGSDDDDDGSEDEAALKAARVRSAKFTSKIPSLKLCQRESYLSLLEQESIL
jgi:hypothetical protein